MKYAKRATDVGIASVRTADRSFSHSDAWRLANRVLSSQLKKGKLHGCIDVGLSVMSIKKKAMCIDLDTEDNIFHLKVTC